MYEIKVDLSDPSKVYIWEDSEYSHQMVATVHNAMNLARDIVDWLNNEYDGYWINPPEQEMFMNKRVFKLKQDVVIPAGTTLTRASNGHGGDLASEAVIPLGKDASAYFVMYNYHVDYNDAPDWVEEVVR